MKLFVIFYIFLSVFIVNSINYIDDSCFDTTDDSSVIFNPPPGVYYSDLELTLSSKLGNIYYYIDNDFYNNEPIQYTDSLYLRGDNNLPKDYEIIVYLEKFDGGVNIIKKKYKIDLLKHTPINENEIITEKSIIVSGKTAKIKYNFATPIYNFKIINREIEFPNEVKANLSSDAIFNITSEELKDYFAVSSVHKDGRIYSEYKYFILDNKKPGKPSFGSLFWGEIYKQDYKISIKPQKSGDIIHYWIREWMKDDIITGPPPVENKSMWKLYESPIALKSKYGKDGVLGIAAFSKNKFGEISDISGPFYFKAVGDNDGATQEFISETHANLPKIILFNKKPIKSDEYSSVTGEVEFNGFGENDYFVFEYESGLYYGNSDLIPCNGSYKFTNKGISPVKIKIKDSSGKILSSIFLDNKLESLPVLKDYESNYVIVNKDTDFLFYMPDNKVKYNFSDKIESFISVDEKSKDFTGKLRLSCAENEEKRYKIKFVAYDKKGNYINECYYIFIIDKNNPSNKISITGAESGAVYNNNRFIKLIPNDKNNIVYYKTKLEDDWIEHNSEIKVVPPAYGLSSVKIYTMVKDRAGNTSITENPFILNFDRRAIFVDTTNKINGNGTEKSPVNNLDKALILSKELNINAINLISESNIINQSIELDSNIIIQPYLPGSRSSITFNNRSISSKKYAWISAKGNSYVELRNIDIYISSGELFFNNNHSKIKIYNSNITYNGNEKFVLFDNNFSYLGINGMNINIINNPDSFSFINSKESIHEIKNINIKCISKNVDLISISKSKQNYFNTITFNGITENHLSFLTSNLSTLKFDEIIFNDNGRFKSSKLFNINKSDVNINMIASVLKSPDSFDAKIAEITESQFKITTGQFNLERSHNFIGFYGIGSEISIDRVLLDVKDVNEYAYGFRILKSKINIISSILRNRNCDENVNFILEDSDFTGINNSIFTLDSNSKNINFWITRKSLLTTINSFYFCNNEKSSFIYLNNFDFNAIRPVWKSNVITSQIVTMENLNKKDTTMITNDFNASNVYHDFSDDFVSDEKYFFKFKIGSILSQSGISDKKNELIPEFDFFGRDRILQSFGVDIGAVQCSGYDF